MSTFDQIKHEIITEIKRREVFEDNIVDRLQPATNFVTMSELINTRIVVLAKWLWDSKVRAVTIYKLSPTAKALGIANEDMYNWNPSLDTLANWKNDCMHVGTHAQFLYESIIQKLGGDSELGGALGL